LSPATHRPLADITAVPGVGAELARVHVQNIGDVEIRRIGGKRALAPLFASFNVPANSDFYPYLDLHAARYRYLHTSADAVTSMGTTGVPVIQMVEGRNSPYQTEPSLDGPDYFEKLELARRARYARDFLLRANIPEPVNIPRPLQKDLEMSKLRLIECRDPGQYDIWFHSLYNLAQSVNPLLPARDARAIWERLEKSSCISALNASQRRWLELFKAVGSRDAARMAQMAEMLLTQQSDLPADHRQYLLSAGLAGYIAQNRRADAAAMLARHKDDFREENLGLRLLKAHAGLGTNATK
jgi:hypothetical protein